MTRDKIIYNLSRILEGRPISTEEWGDTLSEAIRDLKKLSRVSNQLRKVDAEHRRYAERLDSD